jgi:serine/threonine protein kinase
MNEQKSAPASLQLLSGAFLCDGKYRLKRRLGGGKYAEVYLAIDQDIERTSGGESRVAIKIPRPTYWHHDEALNRLKREGNLQKTSALGRHNKVVSVVDMKVVPLSAEGIRPTNVPVLVMEYVEHITLAEYLQRHGSVAPPDETFATLIKQLGHALDWIHTHDPGVIHRDLAPHNILLRCAKRAGEGTVLLTERDDFVQLSDFGLAFTESESRITQEDEYERRGVAANLCYASPEILYGERPTVQADIYSFGALVFKMLTGGLAFPCSRLNTEKNLWDYARLVKETPVIFPDPEAISKDIQDIIIKAMAKKRSERYAQASKMTAALQDALYRWDAFQRTFDLNVSSTVPVEPAEDVSSDGEQPQTPPGPSPPPTQRQPVEKTTPDEPSQPFLARLAKRAWGCLVKGIGLLMLIGLGLTILIALVIGALTQGWLNREDANASAPHLTPISESGAYVTLTPIDPSLQTPDAGATGDTSTPASEPVLTEAPVPTRNASEVTSDPVTLQAQAEGVDFAYVSQRGDAPRFMAVPTTDEAPDFPLFHTSDPLGEPAWSPNAELLAYVLTADDVPGVHVTDGLTTRRISPTGVEEHSPTWSRDGNRLIVDTREGETSHLSHINLDTGTHEPLTGPYFNAWAPAWAPTEEYVAFVSDMEGSSDVYLLLLADLDRSPINVSRSGDVEHDAPAWAPDGKWLIYATTEGLRWVSIENAEPGTPHIFTENGRDRAPCFLNEREVLFQRTSAAGTVSVFKGRLGNATQQRLVDHAAWPTCGPGSFTAP